MQTNASLPMTEVKAWVSGICNSQHSFSLICCKGTWLIIEMRTRRAGAFQQRKLLHASLQNVSVISVTDEHLCSQF
jgi:hypothetical protein